MINNYFEDCLDDQGDYCRQKVCPKMIIWLAKEIYHNLTCLIIIRGHLSLYQKSTEIAVRGSLIFITDTWCHCASIHPTEEVVV